MKHQRVKNSGMMIDDDLLFYIRMNPKWYLILSRYPNEYDTLVKHYKVETRSTFNDKLDKVSMMIQMLEMIL